MITTLRAWALRFALAVPRPVHVPYVYTSPTLKELEAATMHLTTAACDLADAAQYADSVLCHPSVSIRAHAAKQLEARLRDLDATRHQAYLLVKQARCELGR